MHEKGLAYNTICGYRSAISEVHEHIDGAPIGSHPDVSRTLQAIGIQNPPPNHSDDPIDIGPSLDYIRELGDNDIMSIRDLTIKTAFLLALVTASRPSDLRKTDLTTLRKSSTSIKLECIAPKEYKIARAHSLSTTKAPVKQLYIGVYKDDPYLCPYAALTALLSRTEDWRNTMDQKRAIFLITVGPHTPAATDTISGWIKSIVQRSSSSSSAKDMRVISAFLLQNSGADLASVLALGNWSSNTTYQRFYQRGIKRMLERNQTSSLIIAEASNSEVFSPQ
jgi:hypothetical protein